MKPFTFKTYTQYQKIMESLDFLENIKTHIVLTESKLNIERDLSDDCPDYLWNAYDDLLHKIMMIEKKHNDINEFIDSYNCYLLSIC